MSLLSGNVFRPDGDVRIPAPWIVDQELGFKEEAGGFLVTKTFLNIFSIFLYFDTWCSDICPVVLNRLQPDQQVLNQRLCTWGAHARVE